MNIIGDIAGQYDCLLRLVERMPKEEILLVGDLMDRGKDSKKVIEWAMQNKIMTLRGNHEDMMIDFYRNGNTPTSKYYGGHDGHAWLWNGGSQTLESYGMSVNEERHGEIIKHIPEEHIQWLESLPLYYEADTYLVTHAPISKRLKDWKDDLNDDGLYEYGRYVLWCREEPKRRDKLQIFGHNSHWGMKAFGSKGSFYAVCLDDSRKKMLTGLNINLDSFEIYQESWEKDEILDNAVKQLNSVID